MRPGFITIGAAFCALLPLTPVLAESPQPLHVWSVLAPGQGRNITLASDATHVPSVFTSQLKIYRDLARSADELTDETLAKFYRPAEIDDVPPGQRGSVEWPKPGVRIVRDRVDGLPHVYGATRDDAMFGVGFARAEDRLWQMEVSRWSWRSAKTAILGPGAHDENLKDDAWQFLRVDYSEAEYQAMFDQLSLQYGAVGRRVQRDLRAYIAGINAFIASTAHDPSRLPIEFRRRHLTPSAWSVTDEMADQAMAEVDFSRAGGEIANARVIEELRARLGNRRGDAVYADLRHAADPASDRSVIADDRFALPVVHDDPRAIAMPDLGSFTLRSPVAVERRSFAAAGPVELAMFRPRFRTKSNALLIGRERSATGRPISVQGPQDEYGTPHPVDSEIAISAPDFAAHGVLESGPYPYNGARGRDYAFSLTVQFSDTSDTFAEVLCEPDGRRPTLASMSYRYRGTCRPFALRTDRLPMKLGSGVLVFHSERSVHGPVIGRGTVDGRPVAFAVARGSYFHELRSLVTFSQVFSPSIVRSASDFVRIVREGNWDSGFYYIDRRDIAYVHPVLLPLRAHGTSGDWPLWGTGKWDWRGFDPVRHAFAEVAPIDRPQAIDPAAHFIAGWNNQSAPGWKINDSMWDVSPFARQRLLSDAVRAHRQPFHVADVVRIHERAALTDVNAGVVYPALRRIVQPSSLDPLAARALRAMDRWMAHGALRQPDGSSGDLRDGGAIALYDAWAPLAVHAIVSPVLGPTILAEAGSDASNLPALAIEPGWVSGWTDILERDLMRLSGVSGARALRERYCGQGRLRACRAALLASLHQAIAIVAKRQGLAIDAWRMPAVCSACDDIAFPPSGDAVAVPAIPWQNRPTYELVVY